ncbi:MAG: glycoside hydrolase family 95 protein, partial [Rikenellaceae bacterium]|nr:glycoside hydrolase family 95 protein [Rikenellaceae bacterium]
MKKLLIGLTILSAAGCRAPQEPDLKLWYERPASVWVEALPLGNGRLGAMVFGDPLQEEFQLNEETIWGGSPYNNTNPKAQDALPEIRELIFAGKNAQAQALCGPTIISPRAYGMPYQTIGSLRFDFQGTENYTDYYRELNLRQAVAKTTFTVDDVRFEREMFTSFPDQLVVIRLTSSHEGKISFRAFYDTPFSDARITAADNMIRIDGKGEDREGIEGKVRFTTLSRIKNRGGTLESSPEGAITVSGADQVIIHISTGTNFVNYDDISGDPLQTAERHLAAADGKSYEAMKEAHIAYYRRFFDRVSLDLGRNQQADKPTDR